jgi:hypothetical protein
MTTLYLHTPLSDPGSIRLLLLDPVAKPALRGSLVETPLSSGPKFSALSYVWGSTEPTQMELLNISSPSGELPLKITKNCARALRHIRHPTEIRTLWVDAVCIDQTSDEEKSVQVAMMASIYHQATQVLTWLDLQPLKRWPVVTAFRLIRRTASWARNGRVYLRDVGEERDIGGRQNISIWKKICMVRWQWASGMSYPALSTQAVETLKKTSLSNFRDMLCHTFKPILHASLDITGNCYGAVAQP